MRIRPLNAPFAQVSEFRMQRRTLAEFDEEIDGAFIRVLGTSIPTQPHLIRTGIHGSTLVHMGARPTGTELEFVQRHGSPCVESPCCSSPCATPADRSIEHH